MNDGVVSVGGRTEVTGLDSELQRIVRTYPRRNENEPIPRRLNRHPAGRGCWQTRNKFDASSSRCLASLTNTPIKMSPGLSLSSNCHGRSQSRGVQVLSLPLRPHRCVGSLR